LECRTETSVKERVDCPAGADRHNASDVHERCTKSWEKEVKTSCRTEGSGQRGNNSSGNRPEGGGNQKISRAADNGSKK
jgi:hypothetical protein